LDILISVSDFAGITSLCQYRHLLKSWLLRWNCNSVKAIKTFLEDGMDQYLFSSAVYVFFSRVINQHYLNSWLYRFI
jgi:hypothetical protein